MSELPFGKLFNNIIDNRGKTCPTATFGTPLIATNCIKNEQLYPVFEKVRYVDDETMKYWFRGHPKPGNILFVTKGTPGKVAWVPNPVNFCIAQDMLALDVNDKLIYPKYLFAVLRSNIIQGEIENLHVGSLIPHFKKGDFDRLSIPIPERSLQEYIGDSYFDFCFKIDLLHRNNKTLEQLAETLFRQWFVEEARENWDEVVLDDICSKIGSGGTPPTKDNTNYNGEINWYSTKELNDNFLFNSISKITEKGLTDSSAKLFPKGTVLMAIYAAPTVGRLGILSSEATFNQAACGFVPNHKCCTEFIYLFLKSQRDELNLMATGSAQQNLNVSKVRNYSLLLPPEEIMNSFKNQANILFTKIETNQMQIQKLENLRDTLLPKLMSGEVRVKTEA